MTQSYCCLYSLKLTIHDINKTIGCCFLDLDDENIALANRVIHPDRCIETASSICNLEGGAFQGEGTSCIEFPVECSFPTKNVPTLSQWGLIAMAGLLVFSV